MEEYQIGSIVKPSEVPNWARRERKWGNLIDAILSLACGQTLPVRFSTEAAARRARNTVRDTVNLRLDEASIRTRLVKNSDEGYTVFFTRLHPIT